MLVGLDQSALAFSPALSPEQTAGFRGSTAPHLQLPCIVPDERRGGHLLECGLYTVQVPIARLYLQKIRRWLRRLRRMSSRACDCSLLCRCPMKADRSDLARPWHRPVDCWQRPRACSCSHGYHRHSNMLHDSRSTSASAFQTIFWQGRIQT